MLAPSPQLRGGHQHVGHPYRETCTSSRGVSWSAPGRGDGVAHGKGAAGGGRTLSVRAQYPAQQPHCTSGQQRHPGRRGSWYHVRAMDDQKRKEALHPRRVAYGALNEVL